MVLEQALTQLVAALEQPVLQSVSTTPAPRSTTLPDGLTAREVEVLQLVASGLTDAQVADRLIISRRTVNAHLASIYSKIGMNTRSAATRYAIEQGLL
jgi:DNA-binding CsgD family transcriptional regulator